MRKNVREPWRSNRHGVDHLTKTTCKTSHNAGDTKFAPEKDHSQNFDWVQHVEENERSMGNAEIALWWWSTWTQILLE